MDNENEIVSRCEILPRLCQTLPASCTNSWIALYVSMLCCHFTAEKKFFSSSFRLGVKFSYTSARGMVEWKAPNALHLYCRIGGRTELYSTAKKNMLSWKRMIDVHENSIFKRKKKTALEGACD